LLDIVGIRMAEFNVVVRLERLLTTTYCDREQVQVIIIR